MPEPIAAAPVVTPEATPAVEVSSDPIEAAIASSIADIRTDTPEPDESGGAAPAVAAVVEPAADATTSTVAPPVAEQVSKFDALIDKEMGAGHSKKRDNRIPYSRTVKIVENAVADAKTQWQTEHEASVKPHTDKIAEYERQVADHAAVERLIQTDDATFMANLAEAYPAYRKYLGPQAPNERPAPDVELADGRKVYSEAGQQKLEAWQDKQFERRLAARLEPLEKEQKQKEIVESLRPGVVQSYGEAMKWPLFKESQSEILKALQADEAEAATTGRRMQSHAEIYIKTVIPKLVADRTKMREELLAELNTRPHTTATAPTTPRTPDASAPKDLEDIIRASIRKA